MKSGCVATSTFNLSTGWRWVVSFMLSRCLLGQTNNETVWMRDCMVLRAGLVVLLKRKNDYVPALKHLVWPNPLHISDRRVFASRYATPALRQDSVPLGTPLKLSDWKGWVSTYATETFQQYQLSQWIGHFSLPAREALAAFRQEILFR